MCSALARIAGANEFGHLLEDLQGFPAGFCLKFFPVMVNKEKVFESLLIIPLSKLALMKTRRGIS